jgi:hypothetical protein
MEQRASAWDRLQAEWGALAGLPLPDRTAMYDELLARGGALTPASDGYPAARLAREHARRVSYWRDRLSWAGGAAEAAPGVVRGALAAARWGWVIGAVALVALAAWRGTTAMAILAGIGIAASAAVHLRASRRAERPELGEALERGLCPDCGYELGGLPPALTAGALAGLDVGPASCPECGGRWPRVPPPAPERGGAADEA